MSLSRATEDTCTVYNKKEKDKEVNEFIKYPTLF